MQANYFIPGAEMSGEWACSMCSTADAAKSSFQTSESVHGWRGRAVERICRNAIESKGRGGRWLWEMHHRHFYFYAYLQWNVQDPFGGLGEVQHHDRWLIDSFVFILQEKLTIYGELRSPMDPAPKFGMWSFETLLSIVGKDRTMHCLSDINFNKNECVHSNDAKTKGCSLFKKNVTLLFEVDECVWSIIFVKGKTV